MTTGGQVYPSRVPSNVGGADGHIALDQMRTVDRQRLVRHLGRLDAATQDAVLDRLAAFFAR